MGRYYNLRETFSRSMEISPTSSPYVEKESLGKTYKSRWINASNSGISGPLNFKTKNGYLYPVPVGSYETYSSSIGSNLSWFAEPVPVFGGTLVPPEIAVLTAILNASCHHDISYSPGYGGLPFLNTKQRLLFDKSFSLSQLKKAASNPNSISRSQLPKLIGTIYMRSDLFLAPLYDGSLSIDDNDDFPGISPGLFQFGNQDKVVSLYWSTIGYAGTTDYKKYYATMYLNLSLFENLAGRFKISSDLNGPASKTNLLSQISSSDGNFLGGIRLLYKEDITNALLADAAERGDSEMLTQGGEFSYAGNSSALGYEPIPKIAVRTDNRKSQMSFANPLAKGSYAFQTASSLIIGHTPSMGEGRPVYIDYPRIYEINAWQGPSTGWSVGKI